MNQYFVILCCVSVQFSLTLSLSVCHGVPELWELVPRTVEPFSAAAQWVDDADDVRLQCCAALMVLAAPGSYLAAPP